MKGSVQEESQVEDGEMFGDDDSMEGGERPSRGA